MLKLNQIIVFNEILKSFKISAVCKDFTEHKNVDYYDITLNPGAKVKEVEKYAQELSLILQSTTKPQIKCLSKEGLIRLGFLKAREKKINLFEFAQGLKCPPGGKLNCLIGETLEGQPLWIDIVKTPHTLVAGATGSGKSTLLHSIIANILLFKGTKLYLMDPKNIEFFKYEDLKDSNVKIDYSYNDCLLTIQSLVKEMERRYDLMKEHRVTSDYFSYIVLIVDEFANLIGQDVDRTFFKCLCQLAQKSRAAGIHIIISTQRPSVDVVEGSIKANFPSRISCKVVSAIDSRVILDSNGAESLLGSGDALINSSEFDLQRFQVAYTTPEEVVSMLGKRRS